MPLDYIIVCITVIPPLPPSHSSLPFLPPLPPSLLPSLPTLHHLPPSLPSFIPPYLSRSLPYITSLPPSLPPYLPPSLLNLIRLMVSMCFQKIRVYDEEVGLQFPKSLIYESQCLVLEYGLGSLGCIASTDREHMFDCSLDSHATNKIHVFFENMV